MKYLILKRKGEDSQPSTLNTQHSTLNIRSVVFGKFILILRDGGLWRGCVRMTMLRMLRITKLTVAARGPFVIDFE